jgi:hypothetical protein
MDCRVVLAKEVTVAEAMSKCGLIYAGSISSGGDFRIVLPYHQLISLAKFLVSHV